MNVDSVSPFRKDGTPKKKTGRPKNSEKPLGRADLTKMARKLGNVTDEALDLIIAYMKNAQNPEKERVRIASQIVGTVQGLIQQVDRQTLMKKNLQLLDMRIEEAEQKGAEIPEITDDENSLAPATVFTLDIVPHNRED